MSYLNQWENERDDFFDDLRQYTNLNPIEQLSTEQLIEKISLCLGTTTKPLWNEFLRRIKLTS